MQTIIAKILFIAILVNAQPIEFQEFNKTHFWINFSIGFVVILIVLASAVLCTYQLIEGTGIWACCGKSIYDSDDEDS